jgi:glyoxylase-like metal-dependent hydrolase (beta-lactamase superfamily II)
MHVHLNAAEGVHWVEDAYTNWYLLEEDGRITVVDAGLPTSWERFHEALRKVGRRADDVEAVVLTHGHFDHVGFAERARSELHVPVYVHEDDVPLTKHPWRYDHEQPLLKYVLTQVRALPIVATYLRNRAWWPSPVREVVRFQDGVLPVPGSPRVVPTPGHTHGHCALHLADRDAVIAGDAVVTLDPYTARRGPRLVARAATVDAERNLRTLDALAETGARTVLVGHGEPWVHGVADAVAKARANGAA